MAAAKKLADHSANAKRNAKRQTRRAAVDGRPCMILALLIYELKALFSFGDFEEMAKDDPETGRTLLLSALDDVETESVDAEALGHWPVVLPYWLLSDLVNGLDALNKGETQPLLRRRPSEKKNKGHGPVFTKARLQFRALQFVEFFVGQNTPRIHARIEVANAIGAKEGTLKTWKRKIGEADKESLETAFEAGRTSRALQNGEVSIEEAEKTEAYKLLRELEREPLAQFGRRYRPVRGACALGLLRAGTAENQG